MVRQAHHDRVKPFALSLSKGEMLPEQKDLAGNAKTMFRILWKQKSWFYPAVVSRPDKKKINSLRPLRLCGEQVAEFMIRTSWEK